MFTKILIANRGEIAVRIARACKEMGIAPVAVYSEVDRVALHVAHCYEAYPIGGSESRESYLNIERVVDAARKSGAQAVHPGYGFLAENAAFAQACEDAGLVFIGPTPAAIRAMGNKLEARAAMKKAGVPIVPGSDGPVSDPKEAVRIADAIGYPVLLKAAAGGGGKGMRVVKNAAEFATSLELTMGEAAAAFKDPSVYIEKFIENPKHIEIQVMADSFGHVVSYGERECSMQRRYQKVIEEAPSPVVSEELRAALSDAGRKAAAAVHYRGAGTIEFILDPSGKFYFLEMNTRLQVEHPVTEMVYGVDLVKQQIHIAAGEHLDVQQTDIVPRGHAIEMRIYAEDASRGFMPSIGRIKRQVLPSGPGIRNENGVYAGYEIPIYYDPMIGKLVVWAESREAAIPRARRALREYRCEPVHTNVDFLLWALHEPSFLDGSYTTKTIETVFKPDQLPRRDEEVELAAVAAAIAAFNYHSTVRHISLDEGDGGNAWQRAARTEGTQRWSS
ncbi:MAG TPA: acetyl-CoA carboxylase biotin carboxylase subunit [Candidatus Krumholzibacteria bacterium]|nr:acetyl-CoA carboxylase biotin carboxylase subunit [Candidatus Krumholzibacteria bacterium]